MGKNILKKAFKCIFLFFVFLLFLQSTIIAKSRIENKNSLDSKEFIKREDITKQVDYNSDNGIISSSDSNEVIIVYDNNRYLNDLKFKLNSALNNYSVEKTIEIENVKVNTNNGMLSGLDIAKSSNDATNLSISLIKSDKYSTEELIEKLKDKSWILSAEPNYKLNNFNLTNDTLEDLQWGIENKGQNAGVAGKDMNPIVTTSQNEKVIAVIDTGVDYGHQDLKNSMWVNPYSTEELPGRYGYDFADEDDDPMDADFHGTHCAGIIAAQANNVEGITGAVLGANNIKIMALKIFDQLGNADTYSAIQAYTYIHKAQQLGTNVVAINNSWGAYIKDGENERVSALKSLIDLVGAQGAISVCAMGNDGIELNESGCVYGSAYVVDEDGNKVTDDYGNYVVDTGWFRMVPACLDSNYIISVSATNESDELASFSNYGLCADVCAPGENILSTMPRSQKSAYPALLSDEEKNTMCKYYYDFNNGLGNFHYNLRDLDDNPTYNCSKGTVTTSNEKFFGKNGASLKWTFNWTEEDIARCENGECSFPALEFNVDEFSSVCTSFSIYAIGPQNTERCVDVWGTISEQDEESGRNYSKILALGSYNTNSWLITNYNWVEWAVKDRFLGDVQIVPYPDVAGTYTIYIDNIMISKELSDSSEIIGKNYSFLSGTSMATPFVTAECGIMSNLYNDDTALQRREKILNATRTSDGKTAHGNIDMSLLELPNEDKTKIKIPEFETNLEYNGKEQTIASHTENYIVSGSNIGKSIGKYSCTLTLRGEDKEWEDGTKEPKTINWSIIPREITVTAKEQTITEGGDISKTTDDVVVENLASGHKLSQIYLLANTFNKTITPNSAKIVDITNNEDVTANYKITYKSSTLSIGNKQQEEEPKDQPQNNPANSESTKTDDTSKSTNQNTKNEVAIEKNKVSPLSNNSTNNEKTVEQAKTNNMQLESVLPKTGKDFAIVITITVFLIISIISLIKVCLLKDVK